MLIRVKAGSGSVSVGGLGERPSVSKSRLGIHAAAIGSWLFGRCREACMRVTLLELRGHSKVDEISIRPFRIDHIGQVHHTGKGPPSMSKKSSLNPVFPL